MNLKNAVFWVVEACSSERDGHFGATFRLHLHDQRLSQIRNSAQAPVKQSFDPEDGGAMFLRNSELSLNYTVLQTRKSYSSIEIIVLWDVAPCSLVYS
jgi:hypothetical protein